MTMFFKVLSVLNILFFLSAQLHVCMPLTFKFLRWAELYKILVIFIIATRQMTNFYMANKYIPSESQLDMIIFSNDLNTRIKRLYRLNTYSFLIYQTILILIL